MYVYKDTAANPEHYGTSDYPQDHPLYSTANKKVLGKMKDEFFGGLIAEYVGLRPRMYFICRADKKATTEPKA